MVLVGIGVAVAVVATAGWAIPALPLMGGITGATAVGAIGVGGIIATVGGGVGTFAPAPEDDRGVFLGATTVAVASQPVDAQLPTYDVITKPCP